MTHQRKKEKNFLVIQHIEKQFYSNFSHHLDLVIKKNPFSVETDDQKFRNVWYKKQEEPFTAFCEVIAQEFFRLLIATQPKTRLLVDEQNQFYVLSKRVRGFFGYGNIPKKFLYCIKEKIAKNTHKGLGSVMVASLFLNEVDFKFGNIGLDAEDNIVKIDGDWCFARFRENFKEKNFLITPEVIKQLPNIADGYDAFNWWDEVVCGFRKEASTIDRKISRLYTFRDDVNDTLLKILVIPEEVMARFVNCYGGHSTDVGRVFQEMSERRVNLKNAACENQSFRYYMASVKAKRTFNYYLQYLALFKTTGKNCLIQDAAALKTLAEDRFNELLALSQAKRIEGNTMVNKQFILFRFVKERKVESGVELIENPVVPRID